MNTMQVLPVKTCVIILKEKKNKYVGFKKTISAVFRDPEMTLQHFQVHRQPDKSV